MLNGLRYALPGPEQPMLFDIYRNRSAEVLPDYDGIPKLNAELDVTGIPFNMHPAVLLPKRHVTADRLGDLPGREVTVAGFVATARRTRTNDDRVMGFVTLKDVYPMDNNAWVEAPPDKGLPES